MNSIKSKHSKAGGKEVACGNVYVAPQAQAAIPQPAITAAVERHRGGDWGEVDDEERSLNNEALRAGSGTFVSCYCWYGVKFWIVTDTNLRSTLVRLDSEFSAVNQ